MKHHHSFRAQIGPTNRASGFPNGTMRVVDVVNAVTEFAGWSPARRVRATPPRKGILAPR